MKFKERFNENGLRLKEYDADESNTEITVGGLRHLLFELQNQRMTVEQLRKKLFDIDPQEMVLTKYNISKIIR